MDMAEQNEEQLDTVQDSPTEEIEQAVDTQEVETEQPQEKNWKAVRQELEEAKKKLAQYESPKEDIDLPQNTAKRSQAVDFYLSPDIQTKLSLDEFKAEMVVPDLEQDSLFKETVDGKYNRALNEYVLALANGKDPNSIPLPSYSKIAKQTKGVWESRFGSIKKQGEEEGARKAKLSVQERESTIEAEGRSDRGRVAQEAADLSTLRRKSREGGQNGLDAIAARLSKSKL